MFEKIKKVSDALLEKGGKRVEEHAHVEVPDEISPELEALLQTDPRRGLSSEEVAARQLEFGLNAIAETKSNPILKFLSYFTGSIAFLIILACILTAVVQSWLDFGIILGLLILNAIIGFFEESRA